MSTVTDLPGVAIQENGTTVIVGPQTINFAPAEIMDVTNPSEGVVKVLVNSPEIISCAFAGVAANATHYNSQNGSNSATSGRYRFYFPTAGILYYLTAWGIGDLTDTESASFTVMKGSGVGASSATALTKSIQLDTSYQNATDSVNTVSVAAGDWIEFRATMATVSALTYGGCKVKFKPTLT